MAFEYEGNCHCGRNRILLQSTYPVSSQVVRSCDCKLCRKNGSIWVDVSGSGSCVMMKEIKGMNEEYGNVVSYSTQSMRYQFCATCGTGLLGQHSSDQSLLLNVRILLGINPFHLQTNSGSASLTVEPSTHEKPAYTGSCDCGAVEVSIHTVVLQPLEVKEDNCSICVRNAFVGIYPAKSQVNITDTQGKLKDYKFGRGFNGHPFCSVCGVHTHSTLYGPPQSVVDRLPPEKQAFVRRQLDIQPINARCLDGVDLAELAINRTDEGTDGYTIDD